MVEHRRPAHRLLRLRAQEIGIRPGPIGRERGSTTLEGIAAIAVAFLLLALIVQVALIVTARHAAEAAVAASARRAARPGVDLETEQARLADTVQATVPGAVAVDVDVRRDGSLAVAVVTFAWEPPGPRFIPVTVSVAAMSQVIEPP